MVATAPDSGFGAKISSLVATSFCTCSMMWASVCIVKLTCEWPNSSVRYFGATPYGSGKVAVRAPEILQLEGDSRRYHIAAPVTRRSAPLPTLPSRGRFTIEAKGNSMDDRRDGGVKKENTNRGKGAAVSNQSKGRRQPNHKLESKLPKPAERGSSGPPPVSPAASQQTISLKSPRKP